MLSVLKETKDYIVVNKPSGLITETNVYEDSLESQVVAYLNTREKKVFVGVVHRLDRVTSGLVLFAKKKSALQYFNKLFETKDIQKTYLAITNLPLTQSKAKLVHYLKRDNKQKCALLFNNPAKGLKKCELSYARLGMAGEYSLLKVNPKTGRFHQIRAQLAHMGMPIYGDHLYGSKSVYVKLGVCLHAFSLEYIDFNSDKKIKVVASLPTDNPWVGFEKLLRPHFNH